MLHANQNHIPMLFYSTCEDNFFFLFKIFNSAVVPDAFTDINDYVILIYVWSPALDEFLVYQRLAGVGSASVDHYVDPILGKSCLAVANSVSYQNGELTTDVDSAVYCMDFGGARI